MPPSTDTLTEFVNLELSRIGAPYVWGGTGPPTSDGYDCSGLPYSQAKLLPTLIVLPRTSQDMFRLLTPCSKQYGAFVFYNVPSDPGSQPAHMGTVLTDTTQVEAPHTGADVCISTIPNNPGESIMGYRCIPQLQPIPYVPPAPEQSMFTTQAIVRLMYFFILHRDPDPGGFATYVNAITNGMSLDQALANMIDSPEGQQLMTGERQLFAGAA